MHAIREPSPAAGARRTALVMLPGAGDSARDLVEQGFVRALRARGLPVDAVAVDARFDHYLDRGVVAALEREVVAPLRRAGAARIWLMGISLGGLGALSYAREHGSAVAGLVLLAPFLGTRGLIAEVTRAGGLQRWQPGAIGPHDDERRLLAWLRDDPQLPPTWLGYGTADRYAPASRLLASCLPARRVMTVEGGHDWTTWLTLWERWLDAGAFARGRVRRRVARKGGR